MTTNQTDLTRTWTRVATGTWAELRWGYEFGIIGRGGNGHILRVSRAPKDSEVARKMRTDVVSSGALCNSNGQRKGRPIARWTVKDVTCRTCLKHAGITQEAR